MRARLTPFLVTATIVVILILSLMGMGGWFGYALVPMVILLGTVLVFFAFLLSNGWRTTRRTQPTLRCGYCGEELPAETPLCLYCGGNLADPLAPHGAPGTGPSEKAGFALPPGPGGFN